MEMKYRTSDIEEVLNALNRLQVIGIANAEIVTFIVQKLSRSNLSDVSPDEAGREAFLHGRNSENNEVGAADGN